MDEAMKLKNCAHTLAMLILQSELYNTDIDIRQAVDDVLDITFDFKVGEDKNEK